MEGKSCIKPLGRLGFSPRVTISLLVCPVWIEARVSESVALEDPAEFNRNLIAEIKEEMAATGLPFEDLFFERLSGSLEAEGEIERRTACNLKVRPPARR